MEGHGKDNMKRSRSILAYAGIAIPALVLAAWGPMKPLTLEPGTTVPDGCACNVSLTQNGEFFAGSCIEEACLIIMGANAGITGLPGCPPAQSCQVHVRLELEVKDQFNECAIYTHRDGEAVGYAEPLQGGGDSAGGHSELACGESVTYQAAVPGPLTPKQTPGSHIDVPLNELTQVVSYTVRCGAGPN